MPERSEEGEEAWERYERLRAAHPDLFADPGAEGISILLDRGARFRVQAAAGRRLEACGKPPGSAGLGVLYEDHGILVLQEAVRFPDGSEGSYFRLIPDPDLGPGIATLPLLEGRVVLVNHFRHSTRTWHLEIPRGFGSRGLSAEENARKELEEEIGAAVRSLTPLGAFHPNTGLLAEKAELFLAEVGSVGAVDRGEAIAEVLQLTPGEVEDRIRVGDLTDSFTLAAFQRARLRGLL